MPGSTLKATNIPTFPSADVTSYAANTARHYSKHETFSWFQLATSQAPLLPTLPCFCRSNGQFCSTAYTTGHILKCS